MIAACQAEVLIVIARQHGHGPGLAHRYFEHAHEEKRNERLDDEIGEGQTHKAVVGFFYAAPQKSGIKGVGNGRDDVGNKEHDGMLNLLVAAHGAKQLCQVSARAHEQGDEQKDKQARPQTAQVLPPGKRA